MEAALAAAPVALTEEAEAERAAREAAGTFRASRYQPARLEQRLRAGEIPRVGERKVTEGRLFVECRKGAAIFCRRRNPSERESIAAEAYLRIVQRYGGELPPVGALLDGGIMSAAGVKLIRRAIDSAVKAPSTWREETEADADARAASTVEEAERAGSLIEAEEAEAGILPAPPSEIAAEMIGALEVLGLTTKEARAVVVRAAELSPTEAAAVLGIGAGSVAPTVSEGARRLRERYPDGAPLVELVKDARRLIAEEAEHEARMEIGAYAYSVRNPDEPDSRPETDAMRAMRAARRYVGLALEERGGWLPRDAVRAARAIEHVGREARHGYSAPGAPLFRADYPPAGRRVMERPTGRRLYDLRRLAEARGRAVADLVADLTAGGEPRPAPTAGALPAPRAPIPYTAGRVAILPERPAARTSSRAPISPAEARKRRAAGRRRHGWRPEWGTGDGRREVRRDLPPAPVVALVAAVESAGRAHVARLAEAERDRRLAKARRMRALAEKRRKLNPAAEAARMRRLLAEAGELTPEERTALGVAADWRAEEAA